MKDKVGNELAVGDIVVYGIKANSNGARGQINVGVITEISNMVKVDSTYTRMKSESIRKCSPKFATMFKDGTIYDI